MMNGEEFLRLGLARTAGLGPRTAAQVRDRYGGWSGALDAAHRNDRELPARVGAALREAAEAGPAVLEACRRRGIRPLFRGHRKWPAALECLGDPPDVLFCRGAIGILEERAVGIVGTRECSAPGAEWSRRTSARVAEAGWAVVSGLARGIDAAAHRGALEAQGETVAVLGCGPDLCFPRENRELYEKIGEHGLLVSEFAPGTPPLKGHFPRRNRILAALSQAIVVVECRLRSGALITARHALDQGKEIFVVPGRPGVALAAGPLALLRDGARPVRDENDLLEDLGGIPGGAAPDPSALEALEALREGAGTAGAVAAALGVEFDDARERLAQLELLGLLEPEPDRD